MPDNGTDIVVGDNDRYDALLLARLADFFTEDAIQWPRRLWDVGSILALEEICEAGSWESQGVLSPAAVDWQRNELKRVIGPDVGLGDRELRRELTTVLGKRLPDPSPSRRQLSQLIDHARNGYLDRWQAALAGSSKPKVERLSRTVAAHLLDLGYSQSFLSSWVRRLRRGNADAARVLESAADLARTDSRDYEVLVAFVRLPQRDDLAARLPSWRSKAAVVDWLRAQGHSTAGVRVSGGFLYSVAARDPQAAAAHARTMIDRLVTRATFLRRDRDGVEPIPHVWVSDFRRPIPLATPARGADVLSLSLEGHMYRVTGTRSQVDDALELAAPVNRGSLGPAVAGAWAAIESLLTHPDDPRDEERFGKAVAADRLASIITCSWPRAELTSLAHHYSPSDGPDATSSALEVCTTNIDRSRAIAQALLDQSPLQFVERRNEGSEYAAAARMSGLLAEPRRTLLDVRSALTIAIRRLYRSRNIVLHGGSTQGVALEASLRTAAPLLGAGLDRIVHAALAEELAPLDLAERAHVALQLVGGETGLSVVELLEPVGA